MKYAFGLVLLMMIGQCADAQFRRSYGSCGPSYSYSQPYYQPTYYNYETVTYREVVIPLLQPYPLFVDPRISYHYLSGNVGAAPLSGLPGCAQMLGLPQAGVQQQNGVATPSANTKEADIDALIDRIEKRVKERNQTQTSSQQGGAYEPDGPPMTPEASYSPVKISSRTWAQVLQTHCAMCHTGEKSKGNFVIFTTPGKVSPTFDAQAAWDAIIDGRMPPKERPRIRAADKELLRKDFGI